MKDTALRWQFSRQILKYTAPFAMHSLFDIIRDRSATIINFDFIINGLDMQQKQSIAVRHVLVQVSSSHHTASHTMLLIFTINRPIMLLAIRHSSMNMQLVFAEQQVHLIAAHPITA